jgi:hypothetical protein
METDSLGQIIEKRIAEFERSDHQPPFSFAVKRALLLHVLPLYVGWTHVLAINSDLQIVSFSHEDPEEPPALEKDQAMKNTALVRGSQIYPELTPLWKTRPAGASDCPDCRGTGIHPITSRPQFAQIICSCGGAGWVVTTPAA